MTSSPSPTVFVGMSGGVDSAVAALLLKRQGYRVVGLFMKNWDERDENGICTSERDAQDVARVCERLDIPHYTVEFVEEYRRQVFERFLEEYASGYTPNPDVLCNREIKFAAFFDKARALGADFLATGHYCQTDRGPDGRARLLKGRDPGKDQSYFLNAVSHERLSRTLFPIGHLLKSEVRELAREAGLPVAEKKDSTGICFIGERNFRPFLSHYLQAQPGEIRTLDGRVVGRHPGSAYFTLGQRKGLGLGGEGEPWFIVAKDPSRNILYVERGQDHPALYADWLEAEEVAFVGGEARLGRLRAKIRYRQADQDCEAELLPNGHLRVSFSQPQRAIAPGQSVVLYDGEVCLGGGFIRRVGPSLHEQGRALPSAS